MIHPLNASCAIMSRPSYTLHYTTLWVTTPHKNLKLWFLHFVFLDSSNKETPSLQHKVMFKTSYYEHTVGDWSVYFFHYYTSTPIRINVDENYSLILFPATKPDIYAPPASLLSDIYQHPIFGRLSSDFFAPKTPSVKRGAKEYTNLRQNVKKRELILAIAQAHS